ncbi:unnamed protein product [Moneuplotes crassus]|uniref:Uncharacterized protein n=1 Tax=Euplotes crassus TaxID=5936 RepID=A0AAD1U415_EUPCR|nr:unnamed protein product [Moneuplotes crassus]
MHFHHPVYRDLKPLPKRSYSQNLAPLRPKESRINPHSGSLVAEPSYNAKVQSTKKSQEQSLEIIKISINKCPTNPVSGRNQLAQLKRPIMGYQSRADQYMQKKQYICSPYQEVYPTISSVSPYESPVNRSELILANPESFVSNCEQDHERMTRRH